MIRVTLSCISLTDQDDCSRAYHVAVRVPHVLRDPPITNQHPDFPRALPEHESVEHDQLPAPDGEAGCHL